MIRATLVSPKAFRQLASYGFLSKDGKWWNGVRVHCLRYGARKEQSAALISLVKFVRVKKAWSDMLHSEVYGKETP